MQQIFAIIGLTWKAAFRYRLFWVVARCCWRGDWFAAADQG